jgi:hypothetical protein
MNLLVQAQNLMSTLRFRKRFNAECMNAFGC